MQSACLVETSLGTTPYTHAARIHTPHHSNNAVTGDIAAKQASAQPAAETTQQAATAGRPSEVVFGEYVVVSCTIEHAHMHLPARVVRPGDVRLTGECVPEDPNAIEACVWQLDKVGPKNPSKKPQYKFRILF